VTTYVGTLTGTGTISGDNISVDVTESDVVTLDVTINADGTFTGTEDQVVTVTVDGATSTSDSGPQAVSGNVNFPNVVTGDSPDMFNYTLTFSSDNNQVTIAGDYDVLSGDFEGILKLNGVLTNATDNPLSLLPLLNPSEEGDVAPPSLNPAQESGDPISTLLNSPLAQEAVEAVTTASAIASLNDLIVASQSTVVAADSAELAQGIPAQVGEAVSFAADTVKLLNGLNQYIQGFENGSSQNMLNGLDSILTSTGDLLSPLAPGTGTFGAAEAIAIGLGVAINSGDGVEIANALAKGAVVGSFATIGFLLTGGNIEGADLAAGVGETVFNSAQAIGAWAAKSQGFNTFLDDNPQLLSAYNNGGLSGLFTEVTSEIWNSAPAALTSAINLVEGATSFSQPSGSDSLSGGSDLVAGGSAAGAPVTVSVSNPLDGMLAAIDIVSSYLLGPQASISSTTIENDYFKITGTVLSAGQTADLTGSIDAGVVTESQFVNSLAKTEDTNVPAVAVEGTMYGAVGTAAEITNLVTNFLPAQVAVATQFGFNPQVFACEALGLAFAFGNETGSTSFSANFGPSNPAMPNTAAGDAEFAAAASQTIFGTASTANLVNAIDGYVTNWKAFYTSNGIPGNASPTTADIDLAARGAAWGDAVGVALANNLGPLSGLTTNFLEDAAQGVAVYSASLASQPNAATIGSTAQLPDLTVNNLSLGGTTLSAGSTASIAYHVQNIGTATASASTSAIYLSADGLIDSSAIKLASMSDSSIGAGSFDADTGSITLPTTLAPGAYSIIVRADDLNQVTESNETNNTASIQITVPAPNVADLTVNNLSLGGTTLSAGSKTSMSYHVQNIGTVAASASTSAIYLSSDGLIDSSATKLASMNDPSIAAGSFDADTGSITLPTTLAPGTYSIIVRADDLNQFNEDNNTASIQITVSASDDQIMGDAGSLTFTDTPTVTLESLGGTGAIPNSVDGLSANNSSGSMFVNITGSQSLNLGYITVAGSDEIGRTSVFVDGAPGQATGINDTGTGILDIGATDAQFLGASSTSNLVMDLPGTNVTTGIQVNGSSSGQNLLQGTSGPIAITVDGQAYFGNVGNDTIYGGPNNDNIFGDGGADAINLGGEDINSHGSPGSTVWIGFYDVGHTGVSGIGTLFNQAVTDIVGGTEIFRDGYGGNEATLVSGFQLGASGNVLIFTPSDWAVGTLSSGGTDYGLRTNTGGLITIGANATLGLVSSPGATPATAEVTLDNISTYADAAHLLNALEQAGVGNINFFNMLPAHSIQHELIAYGDNAPTIHIADIEFFNNTGTALNMNTANANSPGNLTITVSDIVDIVGATVSTLDSHNIFFHAYS
jgi:hypothetical protein